MNKPEKREEDLKTLFDLPDEKWDRLAELLHGINKPAPTEKKDYE